MATAGRPPDRADRGLATAGADRLGVGVLAAWDAFLRLAADVDLEAPSRLPGWTGRDVLAHLGSWEGARALAGLLSSARTGGGVEDVDVDGRNAAVVGAHRQAGSDEVQAALLAARTATAQFLASPERDALGLASTASVLGRLPLLTVVAAQSYELAVHALDLRPCGVIGVPQELLHAGVGALADVTGALAAREGVDASAALVGPGAGWVFVARAGGWTTTELAPTDRPRGGAAIEGSAATILDASAGRVFVPPLLLRRELRAHGLPQLLALAPLVEQVPNIPGGPLLQAAARSLGGVTRLAARLPRLRL